MLTALASAAVLLVSAQEVPPDPPQEEPPPYGAWMEKPSAEWPRFTLINRIEYTDQKHPVAGCGFLVEHGEERVAVTAKHVLTYFKSARMDSVDFADTLKSWTMVPKHSPEDVVEVGALINRDPEESLERIPCDKDWILFRVTKASEKVQALRLRTTPLVPGESIFIVGWRYTEEDCPPIVHSGTLVRDEKQSVVVTAPSLENNKIPGLSGAPVLDAQGYVIGMMSRGSGKLQRLAPVAYPQKILASMGPAPKKKESPSP